MIYEISMDVDFLRILTHYAAVILKFIWTFFTRLMIVKFLCVPPKFWEEIAEFYKVQLHN